MTKGTWEWMIIQGWKHGLTHHMRYIQTREETLEVQTQEDTLEG